MYRIYDGVFYNLIPSAIRASLTICYHNEITIFIQKFTKIYICAVRKNNNETSNKNLKIINKI